MSIYDPVGMPRTLRGTPSHIELATVSVVNSDGTIDAQMVGRTAIKSQLEVPRWYKPVKGDRILTTDIAGDQNRPIVIAFVSDEKGSSKQPQGGFTNPSEPKTELVSALPGSPVNGQEVYFQNTAMGTAGVIWHLRYRSASSSEHKWEFVGGSPYQNHAEEDETLTLASSTFVYQDLAKSPNIVVPIAGTYLVSFGANTVLQSGIAGTELDLRLYTSSNVIVTDFTRSYTGVAGTFEWPVFREDKVELAAATELKMRVAGNQTGASAYRTNARYMRFIPVRVG